MSLFGPPIELSRLPGDGLKLALCATEVELAALVERFGYLAIPRLEANVTVMPTEQGVVIDGWLKAAVSQPCVVSGVPVEQVIDEPLRLRFVRDWTPEHEELELSEGDCDVLPLEEDRIDVGEAVAESLALAVDPYPRADETALAQARTRIMSEEEARLASSPFSALRKKNESANDEG